MYIANIIFIVSLFLSGCGYAVPTPDERFKILNNLIANKNIKREVITTKEFKLYTLHKSLKQCRNNRISIYIEGDGLSWVTSSIISDNPTPINPLALKLSLKDDSNCVIYLARPCQYVNSSKCSNEFWTESRFSNSVIDSFYEALDKIKTISRGSSFRLIGYSGGGAVATILAAKRDDVDELITVAGNIDTKQWTKEHYLPPLSNSLNPADFSGKLKNVEQIHLIAGKDKIVDFSVFNSYRRHFKDKKHIHYMIFKTFDHHCCWDKNWKNILKKINKNYFKQHPSNSSL